MTARAGARAPAVRVSQHADGTWYARPYLGVNRVTGRAMRPYRRFPSATCEAEAQAMAEEWMAGWSPVAGLRVSRRISDCARAYVEDGVASMAPSTVRTYLSALRCYVDPYIGDLDVGELNAAGVRTWQAMALRGGSGRGPVGVATLRKAHSMLSGAWRQFVEDGLADANPFRSVDKPTALPCESVAFEEGEYRTLSAALREAMSGDSADEANVRRRNAAFCAWLALRTGMRCGEACAATLGDWSPRTESVTVSHGVSEATGRPVRTATKGKRSRTVSVADGETCEGIARHARWMRGVLAVAGVRQGRGTPLATVDGSLLRPSWVSRRFSALRDELGLPADTHFHTLRHTHATYLLYGGASIRDIQARLGHADVRVTLSLYAHILPGADEAAAAAFGEATRRMLADDEGGSS